MHFWTMCSTSLAFQVKYLLTKVQNSMVNSKSYGTKHWSIIVQLHKAIFKVDELIEQMV